ncbi:hypothetical protein ACNQR7_30640 [Mycolicibacterium senegalense]|uniref:hypothetical protein n=1 Tax=Mycobacteriaceae TaxID=1762 RepID=UPI003AAB2A2B
MNYSADSDRSLLSWALVLQNPTSKPNEFLIYALGEDTDESAMKVESDLKAAAPDEFVCVPIRFANLAEPTNVYIQPHRWGLWCVVQKAVGPEELFGGSTSA